MFSEDVFISNYQKQALSEIRVQNNKIGFSFVKKIAVSQLPRILGRKQRSCWRQLSSYRYR